MDGTPLEPEPLTFTWDVDATGQDGYKDVMSKEIQEQPPAVAATLLDRRAAEGELVLDQMRLGLEDLPRHRQGVHCGVRVQLPRGASGQVRH